MIPTCAYRNELAEGDIGHDVWSLQVNLNAWRLTQADASDLEPLVEDGIFAFDGRTFRRLRTYQRRRELWIDGVAGAMTFRYLALDLLRPAQAAHKLPKGLLRGQTGLESGYNPGAVNCRIAGAKDCFWTQWRIANGSDDEAYWKAAHGPTAFNRSAERLRKQKDLYYDAAPSAVRDHQFMWECAALFHNWQAAAHRLAGGGFDNWHFVATFDHQGPEDDGEFFEKISDRYEKRRYSVDDRAQWVIQIGAPNIETGREWKDFYIRRATLYVSEYTP